MTREKHDAMARPAPFPWVTFVLGVVVLLAWMAGSNIDEHGFAASELDQSWMLSPWWLVVGWVAVMPVGAVQVLIDRPGPRRWLARGVALVAAVVVVWIGSIAIWFRLVGSSSPVTHEDLTSALIAVPVIAAGYVVYVIVLSRAVARRRARLPRADVTAEVRTAPAGGRAIATGRDAVHHVLAAVSVYPLAVVALMQVRGVGSGSGYLQLLAAWPSWVAGLALVLPAALAEDTAVRAGRTGRAAGLAWAGTALVALVSLWPLCVPGQPPTTDDVWMSVVSYAVLLGGYLVLLGVLSSREGRARAA
ncbi:hypothetical protein [Aeromicrobium sp. IC_218]|uniref:hypothetical protein n=1 Tax=Aeromicrobium sp. IC_218 TaxID=2545468 RepID=UPI0010408EC5|nr:hypothetical protein [Aeromicrobium sp. IC_218]TCJ00613.1 hypothetical protein E0W78_00515 [Aeromicrobium sp. IC_218]